MSSNSNKRESLLTQLENMHKQLNDEYEAKSGQPSANEVIQGAGIRKPNLFSNVLNRREKNPMPMFAGSAAHNGVLTANNGKDISFVMGLSENLLVECRRLQAENEKKTKKLQGVQEEFEQLDEKHKKLDSFHQITSKELTALRDTNWELEVKVQQFSVELKELKDKLNKNRKELKNEQESSQNTEAELEVSILQRSGLEKELVEREKEYFSEMTDLKNRISELNDENDSLYIKLKTLDKSANDNKGLQEELSQSHTLVDQLRQQMTDIEAKNKETGEDEVLRSDLSQSRNEVNGLKKQVAALEAKNASDNDDKALQSNLSQSRNEVSELRKQVAALEAKNASDNDGKALQSKLSQSRNEVSELRKQVAALEAKNASDNDGKALQSNLSQSRNEVSELRKQVTALEAKNASGNDGKALQSKLSQSRNEVSELRKQVAALEAKNASGNDGKALQSNLSQSRNEVSELRKQVTALEAKNTSDNDGKALQSEMSQSRKVIDELRQQSANLETGKTTSDNSKKKKSNEVLSKDIQELSNAEGDLSNPMDVPIFPEDLEYGFNPDSSIYMSLAEVKKFAKIHNMVLIPKIEYSSSNLGRKTESEEQLVNTVGDTNLLALPNDNSSLKKSMDESTSFESMIKRLESCGYKVLSSPEFNQEQERLKELENPSETYLMSKASHLGKILVSQDTYDKTSHPSASQLKKSLEELGFTVMSTDEYEKMLDSVENPGTKYLEEKLAARNQVAVSKEDYKQYISPDVKFIKDHAKAIGYIAIDRENYDEMSNRIAWPTVDTILSSLEKLDFHAILDQFAQKHHLVLLEKKEHEELVSALANPSREYLEDKCLMQEIKPLQLEEYDKLLQDLENPTVQYMNEKAASMNKKLIPLKTFEKLQQTSESPSLDFIRLYAKKNGFILLSEDDHSSMKKTLENPDINYLEAKAKVKNHILVDLKKYEMLRQAFDNPSLEFLTQKASTKGYDVLGTKGHQELLRKAMNPAESELAQMAQGLGSVLVQVQEYEKLKSIATSPSKDFIVKMASELKMVVVEEKEYERLKESVNNKNFLLSSVKEFGFVPIPAKELTALKGSTLENSKLVDIETKLKNLGYVAVPTEQFQELNEPVVERATKEETLLLCSKYSMRPISIEEYEKTKNDSKPTVYSEDELIDILKSHGYAVLTDDEYGRMAQIINCPPVDFIEKQAERHGKVLVELDKYETQVSMLAQPALEYLKEKASNLGYKVENEKELENLRKLNSPSPEYLEQKARSLNMTLIPKEKYQKLLNNVNSPSLSFLQTKSAAMRKQIIDSAEYGEFQRKTSFPTVEEIEMYAETLNMIVVVKDEQDDLLKRIDQPTFDYLEQSLKKFECVAVSLVEYDSLKQDVEEPSVEHLSEKAALKGMLIVEKTEIERLNNPSEEALGEKVKKFSKVLALESELRTPEETRLAEGIQRDELQVVPQRTLADLKRMAEDPSPEFIKSRLESLGYIVLNEEEFEEMKRQADSPDLGELARRAKAQGYVLVRSQELAQQTTADTEDLNSLTKEGSFTLLNPEEYDGLLNVCAEKISKRLVIAICHKSGLVPVSSAALHDGGKFKEYAAELGMVAIPREDYDLMTAELGNPSEQSIQNFARENNLLLLEKSSYDGLMNRINDPSKQQLVEQAAKLGLDVSEKSPGREMDALRRGAQQFDLALVPNSAYEEYLTSTKDGITRETVGEQAAQLGLVVLEQETFNDLSSRASESKYRIEQLAQRLGYHVLTEEKFEQLKAAAIAGTQNLTKQRLQPKALGRQVLTREKLVAHAQKMGLKVLSEEQYGRLQREAKPPRAVRTKRAVAPHTRARSAPDLTKDQVVSASEKFGLVAVDKTEYVRLTRPESLKERAQAANMICVPRSAMVASAASYKPDPTDVAVLPTAYYRRLLSKEVSAIARRKQQEHEARMQRGGREIRSTVQAVQAVQAVQHPPGEKKSVNSLRIANAGVGGSPMSRDRSLGALSLNTVESLDEPQIIPALTQTVIGEYLYKYYQVLGMGQESRHERYFWVHPYTMTLYWSPTNPVLESSTNHSTKCASIVSVDTVADPSASQGAYHSLLVITTDSRTIKIACPTRQRHNVWYNSLRYLIQRSMLGIDLEDIAENPTDSMYSGKIFPLAKQPSQKQPRPRALSLLKSRR